MFENEKFLLKILLGFTKNKIITHVSKRTAFITNKFFLKYNVAHIIPAIKTNISEAIVFSLKFPNKKYPKFESIITELKIIAFVISFSFKKYTTVETTITIIKGIIHLYLLQS